MKEILENAVRHFNSEGWSDEDIAEYLSISKHQVSTIRYELGIRRHDYEDPLYKKHHDDILKLYNKGLSDQKIADSLGINYNVVYLWRTKNKKKPNFWSKREFNKKRKGKKS